MQTYLRDRIQHSNKRVAMLEPRRHTCLSIISLWDDYYLLLKRPERSLGSHPHGGYWDRQVVVPLQLGWPLSGRNGALLGSL